MPLGNLARKSNARKLDLRTILELTAAALGILVTVGTIIAGLKGWFSPAPAPEFAYAEETIMCVSRGTGNYDLAPPPIEVSKLIEADYPKRFGREVVAAAIIDKQFASKYWPILDAVPNGNQIRLKAELLKEFGARPDVVGKPFPIVVRVKYLPDLEPLFTEVSIACNINGPRQADGSRHGHDVEDGLTIIYPPMPKPGFGKEVLYANVISTHGHTSDWEVLRAMPLGNRIEVELKPKPAYVKKVTPARPEPLPPPPDKDGGPVFDVIVRVQYRQ